MKKVLLLLLMMIILPLKVHATDSITATCSPSEVKPGNTVACKIKGNSESTITKFNANIAYGDDVTLESSTLATSWEGSINNNVIDVNTTGNMTGEFDIITLNLKVKDTASAEKITLSVTAASFKDDSDNPINLSETSTSFDVDYSGSNNTGKGLATLTAVNGTLLPPLSADNFGYTIILDSADTETFKINATAVNENDSIVYMNGETNDTIDNNNITFTTTGGNDLMLITIKVGTDDRLVTYNITVSKPQKEEIEDAELKTLVIGDQNVPLVPGQLEYTVTLSDVSSYKIEATLKDSKNYKFSNFTVQILSPLEMSDENEFAIIIEPKDPTAGLSSVTYIINVKGEKTVTTTKVIPSSSSNNTTPTNPQTGGFSTTIVAIILIASFMATIYLYKKNINGYNE